MTAWRMLAALAVAVTVGGHAALAADIAAARATVQSALEEGIGTFASGKTYPFQERRERLEGLIRSHTDPELLSAAVLGRTWIKLPAEQQSAFATRLVGFLVTTYAGMLNEPADNISFAVGEPEDLGSRVRVPSEIHHGGAAEAPTRVDWTVAFAPDGHPGIVDIAVDGVSVTRAMREDFTSVLRSSGGMIQGLLDALVHKAEANEQIARNDRVAVH